MDAAAPFLASFAAERPPDLVVSLRAMCERCLRAPVIQAPAPAGPGPVPAVPQVGMDPPEVVVKLKQLHLQRQQQVRE